QPEGSFDLPPDATGLAKDLDWLVRVGAMASNAAISRDDEGHWQAVGDPTEAALVVAALKSGFDVQKARLDKYKEEREIPFSSEEKRMAVYYRIPEGFFVMAKGSPEIILASCQQILVEGQALTIDEDWQQRLHTANQEMSKQGLRVLGLAYRPVTSIEEEAYQNLIFLGLAGIMDPPREEAKAAIAEAKRAGIRTIMITGDQATTAGAIGERLGLTYGKVITSKELKHMSPEQLGLELPHTSIFARVSPRDKLQIVKVLRSQGQIVAMTGDGVNDAPALKEADIGVAMGIQGTEVAKQAADMVLSDDNFATIVRAISEGRVIFGNIRKFILYLFSCNLSEILVIFLALVIGVPLPLEALQILWLNLVTDVFPALALGWEPPDQGIMEQPPLGPDQQILTRQFKIQILIYGLVLGLTTLAAYVYTLKSSGNLKAARTVAFVTLAAVQLFHTFNIRNRGKLEFNHSLLTNRYLWGAIILVLGLQALAVYVPVLNRILHTIPLNSAQLLLCLLATVVSVLLIQIYNRLQKK
ncbi:MAG: cation-translocating P-type ATPase, partial [Methylocystaceae bacterium]